MDLVKEYKEKSTFKNDKDIFESLRHIFTFGAIGNSTCAKFAQVRKEVIEM